MGKVVVRSQNRVFEIRFSDGSMYVNGVKKKTLKLINGEILEPTKALYKGVLIFNPSNRGVKVYNKLPIDEYLTSVVYAEMSNAPIEALKAQAVLARTFLARWGLRHKNSHVCDRDHCQMYGGSKSIREEHREAVISTKGEVLYFDQRPVEVLFHASCGGWVCEPKYVWRGGKELQYFWTGEDEDCFEDYKDGYTWKVFYSLKSCPRVKRIPGTLRVYALIVENETLYAYDFRRKFNLPSAVFAYWCTSNGVMFLGTGKGHGTGLCQRGAILKAQRGWSYKQILEYYFKGAEIVKIP